MKKFNLEWPGIKALISKSYRCGHCGNLISSERGWDAYEKFSNGASRIAAHIYVCHFCSCPSFFNSIDQSQLPGIIIGEAIDDVDDEKVNKLYEETRNCYKVSAYTSAVLCCRKLLMHIAVSKGAKPNLRFVDYIQYLVDERIIPVGSDVWVDKIRTSGNEANHEIVMHEKDKAESIILFSEMLLRLIYEYPAKAKKQVVR